MSLAKIKAQLLSLLHQAQLGFYTQPWLGSTDTYFINIKNVVEISVGDPDPYPCWECGSKSGNWPKLTNKPGFQQIWIRTRIDLVPWIRIRLEVKNWIRI